MKKQNTKKAEEILKNELARLESELASVGRRNPDNKDDWEAMPEKMDILKSDSNEVADSIEEFEGNEGILKQLEIRYNEVKNAVERIEKGNYGICEVCGEIIEEDRLVANPASNTCKKHMGGR